MKLIVQIPCLNEAQSIAQTLADIPRAIPGVDSIETLILDDASSDDTVRVAREHGADHILSFRTHQGLARSFRVGIEECLRLGADLIVNTDGDNQYCGADIAKLVRPILDKEADFVIGIRDIGSIRHFSWRKKILQHLGSWVVRQLSGTDIQDVTSGFRAFSRDAATKLDLVTDYTHTIETIIAMGKVRTAMAQVQIGTNPATRESRLFPTHFHYVARCGTDMIRIYVRHEPLKVFVGMGLASGAFGLLSGVYYWIVRLSRDGRSYVALALFSLFLLSGLLFVILGFLGDCIAANRRMLSNITRHIRKIESGTAGQRDSETGEAATGED
ncbi:MAG: glycosyltransferase family 2 protein [Kiritimatiellae bacterium]|nr:glycosyltransferase family 2 protein [Kiritimatiellia bacterium]